QRSLRREDVGEVVSSLLLFRPLHRDFFGCLGLGDRVRGRGAVGGWFPAGFLGEDDQPQAARGKPGEEDHSQRDTLVHGCTSCCHHGMLKCSKARPQSLSPAGASGLFQIFHSHQESRRPLNGYSPALSETSRAKPAQSASSRPLATVAVSRSWIKEASGIGTSPSAAASRISP